MIEIILLRKIILVYFKPFFFESYNDGKIYRWIGVHKFGRYLLTGGIVIRKWSKSRMQSYTLKYIPMEAAIEFRYKSCFFEMLNNPFMIILIWRAFWWFGI